MTAFHTHPDPLLPYGGRRHVHPEIFAAPLSIENLSVAYPRSTRPAVRCVSFEAGEGELLALVGPNGAGKSTLLKAVAGLLPILGGSIRIHGVPPGGCHHRTAYLPQRSEIDWRFPVTVERLILSGRYVHLGWLKWPRRQDRDTVRRVAERLGIDHLLHRQISELSGGQQQRILVARALVQGAELLLLDEPFNNLDTETRSDLIALFSELTAAKKTLIVATHDFDDPETVFDRVIRIRDGTRVVETVPA